MERNVQRTGLMNWVALLAATVGLQLAARHAASATAQVSVAFLGLGFFVAALSYFQMRLRERERLERLEFEELVRSKGSSLFGAADADALPAQRTREQFERFFVPTFTVVLFLLQGGAVYFLWLWLRKAAPPDLDRATLAMAICALASLVLFMLGKYSSGLSRLEGQRLLRPAAGYLLLGAFMCVLVAGAEAAAWFGFPHLDRQVARVLCGVLALAAAETLVNLILEIYRPRVRGREERPVYESRLVGLLGQPGGLVTTMAQALDYQFGFKVSDTWFYRFLEERIALLVLLQLTVLLLSTSVVFIEPFEQGLLERFGRRVAVLEPGAHFKWPWPVDQCHRFRSTEVRSFTLGAVEEDEDGKKTEESRVVLWTKSHVKEEFPLLVASRNPLVITNDGSSTADQAVPVNILSGSINVQYQIRDLRDWAYKHSDPDKLLQRVAMREVVSYLVSVDIDEVMSSGRLQASAALRERIQKRADAVELGANILFVGLQEIHPPIGSGRVQVAGAFESVIGAEKEKEARIYVAQGDRAELLPKARAEASQIVANAHADATRKVALAAGLASQFQDRLAAYHASPTVFKQRTYLDTLARAVGPARKYVISVTNNAEIVNLNLENTIPTELFRRINVPSPEKK